MGTMSKKTNSSKGKGKTPAIAKAESKVVQARGLSKPPPAAKSPDKASIKDLKAAIPAPAPAPALPKRKLGLRGAAPWAARHAAKHAAEARARAAEPPPPGSARATIRVPTGAEELKAKIAELHNSLLQIRAYRKNLAKGFYDIGGVLREVHRRKLYEAKGYGSFEAFLEREIDLGKVTALKLMKVASTFLKEAALEHGMDRSFQAIQVLDTASDSHAPPKTPAPPQPPVTAKVALPLKPPLGRVG
jgi:hypothetical protein